MCGGFQLHKWNSNTQRILEGLKPKFRDNEDSHQISDVRESTKTLGLEWRTQSDQFNLTISQSPFQTANLTKRSLVSNIARVFDVLGWFSLAVIKVKILLQRLWEEEIGWDNLASANICDSWQRWKLESPCLSDKSISRCYYPKGAQIISKELHGFSDASEEAYVAVMYLKMIDSENNVHVTLVTAKTKVAPIKRLTRALWCSIAIETSHPSQECAWHACK